MFEPEKNKRLGGWCFMKGPVDEFSEVMVMKFPPNSFLLFVSIFGVISHFCFQVFFQNDMSYFCRSICCNEIKSV